MLLARSTDGEEGPLDAWRSNLGDSSDDACSNRSLDDSVDRTRSEHLVEGKLKAGRRLGRCEVVVVGEVWWNGVLVSLLQGANKRGCCFDFTASHSKWHLGCE
jgi:hypothetical protein